MPRTVVVLDGMQRWMVMGAGLGRGTDGRWGDRGALGDSEKGLSVTLVGGGSSCQVPSGGELGVLLLVGRCFRVAGSCYRNIVVWCLLCCGCDDLAAAPRSPCQSILISRHFERS